MKEDNNLKKLIQIALLASVGAVLMLFQLPYPGAGWYKLDLSDIPALIGGCALGPWAGLAVVLLKNILFALFRFSPEELVGIPMNLIANGIMVVIAALIYQKTKTRINAALGISTGVIVSALSMIPANYFILPLFMKIFMPNVPVPGGETLLYMILFFTLPFNAVKGLITGILTFVIYKRIAIILRAEGEFELPAKQSEQASKA
ncbi:MAG: ECF transporter S component [Firmicutes bacterium]|nr:ECF transporter S component [Bacillota bacterium]